MPDICQIRNSCMGCVQIKTLLPWCVFEIHETEWVMKVAKKSRLLPEQWGRIMKRKWSAGPSHSKLLPYIACWCAFGLPQLIPHFLINLYYGSRTVGFLFNATLLNADLVFVSFSHFEGMFSFLFILYWPITDNTIRVIYSNWSARTSCLATFWTYEVTRLQARNGQETFRDAGNQDSQ